MSYQDYGEEIEELQHHINQNKESMKRMLNTIQKLEDQRFYLIDLLIAGRVPDNVVEGSNVPMWIDALEDNYKAQMKTNE